MAEFTEVMKQKERIHEHFIIEGCKQCPISRDNNAHQIGCDSFSTRFPQEAEEIIMKWAKENPIKTNADKFKEVFGVDVNRNKCLFGHSEECKKHLTCYSCHLTNWWNEEYVEPDKE